jgi:HEAT repeat protein
MIIKNDPKKLFAFYKQSNETAIKDQIIDRLFELQQYNILIDIIKHDLRVRMMVVRRLISENALTDKLIRSILLWLPLSPPHKELMDFIKKNYDEKHLRALYLWKNLHKDSKTALSVILKNVKSKSDSGVINEEYYKLKMLLEESNVLAQSANQVRRSFFNEKASPQERIRKYLQIRNQITPEQEFDLLKNELHDWILQRKFNKDFILTLLNLSRLTYREKLLLIKDIDESRLYFPENFQLLTESTQIPFDSFKNFFSSTTLEGWLKSSLETNYLIDCLYLKENYVDFHWMIDYLKPISYLDVNVIKKSAKRYVLTKENGYFLNEIIPDKKLLNAISESCKSIREMIQRNINTKNFQLEYFLFPLLLVGGKDNFEFIKVLLDRRIVDDIDQTLAEIESYYLEMKQKIDNADQLKKLVEEEIKEKENLISKDYYKTIVNEYLKRITSSDYLHPEAKEYIVKSVPDLEKFSFYAGEKDKISLCRFISIIGIDDYKPLLLEFIKQEDYNVMIHAAIALVVLGNGEGLKTLKLLASSPNFNVRSNIAEALVLLGDNVPRKLIITLLCDDHLKVCTRAIDTIFSLSFDAAFKIIKENLDEIQTSTISYLIEKLGESKMVTVLPVIIDLMKDPTNEIYLAVIKALGNIGDPICIDLLKNIDLNRNPILEIERAKSLVVLGNTQSWRVFNSYLNYNVNYIRKLAKLAIIRLSSGDRILSIRAFFRDQDPLVAVAATVKYYHYYEAEGQGMLLEMIKTGSPNIQYNIAQLCSILPFSNSKPFVLQLLKLSHYGCRYIAAAIIADNGNLNYIKQMEKDLYSMTEEQLYEISNALPDYFSKHAIGILKKLINLQDTSLLNKQLSVLVNFDVKEAIDTLFTLWARSDEATKCELSQAFAYVNSEKVLKFIRENIDDETYPVKAELAYSLAMLGDEAGWKRLVKMLQTEDIKEIRIVLAKVARLNSSRALDVLVKHLNTPIVNLKTEIIKSIGSVRMKEAIPELKKYINSNSSKVKIAVAKALGEIGEDECIELLDMLQNDKDQYVSVAVEIAKQKIHHGVYHDNVDSLKTFKEVYQPNEWLLTEDWLVKNAAKFILSYKTVEKKPLDFFKDKVILSKKELKEKLLEIEQTLSQKLSGCTDIDKIMAAKNEAATEKEKLTTKLILIKSILNTSVKDISDSGWNLLTQAVQSGNESIIKAVIIKSCYSTSDKWIPILTTIIEKFMLKEHSDLLIYSLSKKQSTKVLPLLIYFIGNERARYYFVYFCNYFLVNSDKIDIKDVKEAKRVMSLIEIPEEYKLTLSIIITSLLI